MLVWIFLPKKIISDTAYAFFKIIVNKLLINFLIFLKKERGVKEFTPRSFLIMRKDCFFHAL